MSIRFTHATYVKAKTLPTLSTSSSVLGNTRFNQPSLWAGMITIATWVLIAATPLLTMQMSQASTSLVQSVAVQEAIANSANSRRVAELFDRQTQLLEESIDAVDVSQPNKTEWYFVGVAGYAGQNVFRSETNYARDLFDKKLNTQGRSIALINNEHSWQQQPIATKETLAQALHAVGQKMGEEDVLFLSMSSHGKQDIFVLENQIIEIEDIDPNWLRQTLDDAGIKWRVIAISSCFSGSFIDELITPHTAIITAAAEDRTSFGCTNTAKMTYFGRAFYAQSLGRANSLVGAYKDASKRIRKRELADGFTPSNPKMAVGKVMRQQLPIFERVLFQSSHSGEISSK